MKYLENDRIKLRAPEPEDLDFLYRTENDTSLWEVSSTLKPFSTHILKQYLNNAQRDIYEAKELRLMMEEKITGKTIGIIDLFNFEPLHSRAGVGIMLIKEARGKGYASQGLDLLVEYAFNLLKMRQLYCNIIEGHETSTRLFESKGFVKTGLRKDWINGSSGFKDVGFHQLINTP